MWRMTWASLVRLHAPAPPPNRCAFPVPRRAKIFESANNFTMTVGKRYGGRQSNPEAERAGDAGAIGALGEDGRVKPKECSDGHARNDDRGPCLPNSGAGQSRRTHALRRRRGCPRHAEGHDSAQSSSPCAPPSSLPDCPAGITLITAWSLPNCATCVPGWRPCGSTLEVASYQPLRYAVHGACLSESMRAMIAIVPSRDPSIPRPLSYRAQLSGSRQPAHHTGERRWTSNGSRGTA